MGRRWWIALSVGYAAGIFILSSFPFAGPYSPAHGLDKLIHAAEYALFFSLVRRAAGRRTGVALLFTVLYAGSDELHQAFVPGRHAGIDDFGADLAGILVIAALSPGLALLTGIRRRILQSVISRKED